MMWKSFEHHIHFCVPEEKFCCTQMFIPVTVVKRLRLSYHARKHGTFLVYNTSNNKFTYLCVVEPAVYYGD